MELGEAVLTETGLDLDRAWMVVDEHGEFLTQRELPRMALVRPQLKHSEVVLRAPGMLALHLQIDAVEAAGERAAVGRRNRRLRHGRRGRAMVQRLPRPQGPARALRPGRAAALEHEMDRRRGGANQFSDGFPLLVASEGSLAELNRRLAQAGQAPVGMERFRPNIVLAGLEAHDEDRVDVLRVCADGEVRLRPVKPCARCPIPNIDPATGVSSPEVSDTLQGYRRNEIVDGAVTFGMNAIVVEGEGQTLRVGQAVTADWRFD